LAKFTAGNEENTRTWQNTESALRGQLDQFKDNNNALREQNESLRQQLAKFTADNEENTRTWQNTESALRGQLDQVIADRGEDFRKVQEEEAALRTQLEQMLIEREEDNCKQQQKEAALRSQLEQILVEREKDNRKWEKEEAALRNKLQRREEALKHVQDRSQQIQESTHTINMKSTTRTSTSVRKSDKKHKSSAQTLEQELPPQAQEEFFHQHTVEVQDDNDHTQNSSMSGSNYSSILGTGFMQNLNQCLKDTKAKEQAFLSQIAAQQDDTIQTNESGRSGRSSRASSVKRAAEQTNGRDDTIQTVQSGRSSRGLSVKAPNGILKNGGANNRVEEHTIQSTTHRRTRSEVNEDHTTRSNISHHRNHSESSVRLSKQEKADADDMTSAYLLVDIEAAAAQKQGKQHPVLSASARRVFDGLCKHQIENCTICARVASTKKPVRIEKPIPVSKRQDIPYEDEPTMRPVIGAGIALATVIKELEDEIIHLKMEHSRVQDAFIRIDPARSKKLREQLNSKMSDLAKEILVKSDQVYKLYDVVEVQPMTDFDREIDEKELPWEGIEESA
jgi:hypothetical protein